MRYIIALTFATLLILGVGTCTVTNYHDKSQKAHQDYAENVTFDTAPLTITTQSGTTHHFTVELALTNKQTSQGLMHRKSMPKDHGMLFDFSDRKRVIMWMKNTYIPLDMLFINHNGTIVDYFPNAVPLSTTQIKPQKTLSYVLEINAGLIKELGIKIGDTVNLPNTLTN